MLSTDDTLFSANTYYRTTCEQSYRVVDGLISTSKRNKNKEENAAWITIFYNLYKQNGRKLMDFTEHLWHPAPVCMCWVIGLVCPTLYEILRPETNKYLSVVSPPYSLPIALSPVHTWSPQEWYRNICQWLPMTIDGWNLNCRNKLHRSIGVVWRVVAWNIWSHTFQTSHVTKSTRHQNRIWKISIYSLPKTVVSRGVRAQSTEQWVCLWRVHCNTRRDRISIGALLHDCFNQHDTRVSLASAPNSTISCTLFHVN